MLPEIRILDTKEIRHRAGTVHGPRIGREQTIGVFVDGVIVRKELHSFWYTASGKLDRITTVMQPH